MTYIACQQTHHYKSHQQNVNEIDMIFGNRIKVALTYKLITLKQEINTVSERYDIRRE